MFSKKYRLPASIRLVNAIVLYSPFFTIRIAKNNLPQNRYGFIVSKKIDTRAVVRNRLKRRVRACVEKLHAELEKGYDILVVMRKEAVVEKTEVLFSFIKKIVIERKIL